MEFMLISSVLAVVLSILAVFFANAIPTLIEFDVVDHSVRENASTIIVDAAGVGALVREAATRPAIRGRSWSLMRKRRELDGVQLQMKALASEDVWEELACV